MNRHVNAISGRLSLRKPQRDSLEILDRITELVPPRRDADIEAALAVIKSEYPTVTDFEREFLSICFALATGVGKTRLMGAFISYLHLAHGINNFFVLAPNLTIYNKLIADFTPNTPKYVFKGIAEFATTSPVIITGDNYENQAAAHSDLLAPVKINIFNISKINSEVRGGRAPRIKRLSEYIGQSYFDYLAGLEDLVLIMDESHRYRASAGIRALNELKPILGLELTATPYVETSRGPASFKNVIYTYSLAQAMADGFVKEPAVVTQKNFNPSKFSQEQLEQIKLEDGVRLHENVKVELETYARQTEQKIVKPFLLVIARDTTHAGLLLQLIQSDKFFEGRYRDKVIQVDSSRTGAEEEQMVQRLLAVESTEEPTEIVIHVNMLKEGWDVTNLYTIVPLRAANARILIEQSIGRGLRLPYGKRTGVATVDRLNIVAHDRFQEIIEEANRSDSVIHLKQVFLDPANDFQKTATVVAQPLIEHHIGLPSQNALVSGEEATANEVEPVFKSEAEKRIAQAAYNIFKDFEYLPSAAHLVQEDVAAMIVKKVEAGLVPLQTELEGLTEKPDVASVVARTTALLVRQTIDIPRILVVPKGETTLGFHAFKLDAKAVHYSPVERDLLIQHLRTNVQELLTATGDIKRESRLEDCLIRALTDYDDISYDEHADLLYDLAGQMVKHLFSYLGEEDKVRNVLLYYQKELARLIHAQMQAHQWEGAVEYEVKVSKGFTKLIKPAFTVSQDGLQDFRQTVEDKTKIKQLAFTGFQRCLFDTQKFDSDTERKFAGILDRDSLKWFKPAKGQFQIYYKQGSDHFEYQPDFVTETADSIYMCETKARNEMETTEVLAKKEAALKWCVQASDHAQTYNGKPWKYLLVPHDAIAENMSMSGLAGQFGA